MKSKIKISRKLRDLLQNYTHDLDRDSWKGGGDPLDWPQIEHDLAESEEKLLTYLQLIEESHKEKLALEKLKNGDDLMNSKVRI